MQYDIVVFFGRFRPFHCGHKRTVHQARRAGSRVLILVGSAGEPRSLRNPFTYREVDRMIRSVFPSDDVIVRPMFDVLYNDEQWCRDAQREVDKVATELGIAEPKVGLIGHDKGDGTGFYLDLFPQWESIRVTDYENVNGTDIREQYFSGQGFPKEMPTPVMSFLVDFFSTTTFTSLQEARAFNAKYAAELRGTAKFPVQPTTVDAMVVKSGHVLLIQRKNHPGKGLWALPGGFVGLTETKVEATLRELMEETGIKIADGKNWERITERVLRSHIVAKNDYDWPYRDERARIFTQCFLIHLDPGPLPEIHAADDAADAQWVQLASVQRGKMYADHYHIIQDMIGKIP